MSFFKTYKEAVEFHRNNYPVQTREVLFEKYSSLILKRKNEMYVKKILNTTYPSKDESSELLEKRREFIIFLTKVSRLSHHYGRDSFCVSNPFSYMEKKYENDSDFSSIYELF